jgi:GNAT superfamily N-acetyltransferase
VYTASFAMTVHIFPLTPVSPELALCAQWRIDAFGDVLAANLQDEISSLEHVAAHQVEQTVLFATCDGAPAGTCLLVPKELEPCHAMLPWLAGLYVAPEYRHRGVGRCLVRAIESEAWQRGNAQLFLYTDNETKAYYQALGWRAEEQIMWKDHPTLLMVRDLSGTA